MKSQPIEIPQTCFVVGEIVDNQVLYMGLGFEAVRIGIDGELYLQKRQYS
jgi:hypothetical protein